MSRDEAEVVCSAPGKVLASGGYLILDRPNTGMVLALSARFYSSVRLISCAATAALEINVFSPQFADHRRYRFHANDSPPRLESLPASEGASVPRTNPYVEVPLLYTLALLSEVQGKGFAAAAAARLGLAGAGVRLELTLAADNAFYSQAAELRARGLPLSADAAARLPPLLTPRRDADGEIAKTGLGSSATLVTSLVGALLQGFGLVDLEGDAATAVGQAGLETTHALAQLCHCAAQGKVGSGFDVSAAVYGSHRYCRFSPRLLEAALAAPAGTPPSTATLLATTRVRGEGEAWDHEVAPLALPPGLEVMMGDVCCGAHTPSMVKKVNAWRAAAPDAPAVWAQYAAASDAQQAALRALCALHARLAVGGTVSEDALWWAPLQACGATDPSEWASAGEVGAALAAARRACVEARRLLRQIGEGAGVGIEPPAQTELLDATMAQRGVLLAVVPGAGGADAVLALVLPSAPRHGLLATRARVAALWQCWGDAGGGGGDAGGGGGGGGGAPPPAAPPRAAVCELPVTEASRRNGGRNGVALEGAAAATMLGGARRAMLGGAPRAGGGGSARWWAVATVVVAVAAGAWLVTPRLTRRS